MRATRLHSYGSPLKIEEIEYPRIEKPFDVIVRIAGAGVCHTDLHIIQGMWKDIARPKLPYTLGHENTGYVEEVASGVEGFEKGDPVILHPLITCGRCPACRAGEDMHCEKSLFPGLNVDGGFAEFMRTSHRSLIKLPRDIDRSKLVEIAPLADAGITAYRAVKKALKSLFPGSYVAVIGVGGLGHLGIQMLRILSQASIIAIDARDDKLELASKLGADYIVNARRDPVAEVMKITGGRGVNVAIDFFGGQATLDYGPRILGRMGRLIIVGYGGELRFPSISIIASEISLEGSLVGNYIELREVVNLYLRGSIRVIHETHPLEDVNEVLERLERGEVRGRAVLVPHRS